MDLPGLAIRWRDANVTDMSTESKISAAEIRQLRDRLGLTQAALAGKLGLTRPAISLWEIGRCSPTGAAEILLRRLQAEAGL